METMTAFIASTIAVYVLIAAMAFALLVAASVVGLLGVAACLFQRETVRQRG
jgi:hypothetical protein